MKSSRIVLLITLIGALSPVAWSDADGPQGATSKTPSVVRSFRRWCENEDKLSAEKQELVRKITRTPERGTILRALSALYPRFRDATRALNNQQPERLAGLVKGLLARDNPFLVSNAKYLLARAHTQREDYERAAPLLRALAAEDPPRTQYRADCLFRLGLSQFHLLQREEARETLRRFLHQHAGAPDWQREEAKELLADLEQYRDGSFAEVSRLMEYSRRRLHLNRLGKPTRQKQERIATVLEKMLEKARKQQAKRKKEKGGGGQGGGQGSTGNAGTAPSSGGAPEALSVGSPAAQSQLPGGSTPGIGALSRVVRGDEKETWGNMPPREREKALSHIKSRFPNRYRDLIEQYYKSLQEGE